jgi:phage tail-like protein
MMQATHELSSNGSGPAANGLVSAPATVSARAHLRRGVPDIYRRDAYALRDRPPPFAMRFLEALEEVLDPITATLDSLPAHFDVDLAPEHALAGLATWFGVDEVESLPVDQRREVIHRAGELGRLRGTRAGLELALSLFFPGITVRINDHGSVVVSDTVDEELPRVPASFDVVCEQSLPPETQMAVARCIERWKPVHAHYKLRVRRGDRVKTLPDVPAAPEGMAITEPRPPTMEVPAAEPPAQEPPEEPETPDGEQS